MIETFDCKKKLNGYQCNLTNRKLKFANFVSELSQ